MSIHWLCHRAPDAPSFLRAATCWLGLVLAALLTGCPLTGSGGTTFSISALASEPAEIRLRAGESADVTLSYSLTVNGAYRNENSFNCGTLAGVPGGLTVTMEDCDDRAAFGLDFDRVVTRSVRLQALTVPPGSYDIEFPAQLCVSAGPDLSPEPDDLCGTAVARLRVIVTDAPSLPSAWQSVGGVLNLDEISSTDGVQLIVDAGGRPLAAWVENERVVVRRWDGGAWQTLGAPGGVRAQGRPALAVEPESGAPVVAWTQALPGSTSGATEVQSRRWDGTAWRQLVSLPMSPDDVINAFDPVLLTFNNRLYAAWVEQTAEEGGERIVLQKPCCGRWDNAMRTRALQVPFGTTQLALSWAGFSDPVLAWKDSSGGRVKVVQVISNEPTPIGDFPALNSNSLALVFSPAHGLLLAIAPSAPTAQFQVQRYADGAWTPFGAPQGQPGPAAGVLQLAMGIEAASGAPLLAWTQFTASQHYVDVRRWGGSGWLQLGTSVAGLPPQGRTRLGTAFSVAITGGTGPLLATEVNTLSPGDQAIRVQEFR
jgi:hypothetical protein